jgi:hypothetical protein
MCNVVFFGETAIITLHETNIALLKKMRSHHRRPLFLFTSLVLSMKPSNNRKNIRPKILPWDQYDQHAISENVFLTREKTVSKTGEILLVYI